MARMVVAFDVCFVSISVGLAIKCNTAPERPRRRRHFVIDDFLKDIAFYDKTFKLKIELFL